MPDAMQPEQATFVQSGGEQAGLGEGDVTGEVVNAGSSQDDPVLSMRAGLKVNNVSFLMRQYRLLTTPSRSGRIQLYPILDLRL